MPKTSFDAAHIWVIPSDSLPFWEVTPEVDQEANELECEPVGQ